MNKEDIITGIIEAILCLVALIIAIIGIFNSSEAFECTWYDIMLVLIILSQQLEIRRLVKKCEERGKNE